MFAHSSAPVALWRLTVSFRVSLQTAVDPLLGLTYA